MSRDALNAAFDVDVPGDGTGWGVYQEEAGAVHVMPEFGPKHLCTHLCWCYPEVDLRWGGPLVIHNIAH